MPWSPTQHWGMGPWGRNTSCAVDSQLPLAARERVCREASIPSHRVPDGTKERVQGEGHVLSYWGPSPWWMQGQHSPPLHPEHRPCPWGWSLLLWPLTQDILVMAPPVAGDLGSFRGLCKAGRCWGTGAITGNAARDIPTPAWTHLPPAAAGSAAGGSPQSSCSAQSPRSAAAAGGACYPLPAAAPSPLLPPAPSSATTPWHFQAPRPGRSA